MAGQIGKILVPLDGSKNSNRGLEMAIGLASVCGASITGVVSIEARSHSEFKADVSESVPDETQEMMDGAAALAARSGVDFRPKIMHGNIGYNIIRTAHSKREKFDMIVIGSRGRGAVKEMFFGSVSNYVIHTSKIPVLVVK